MSNKQYSAVPVDDDEHDEEQGFDPRNQKQEQTLPLVPSHYLASDSAALELSTIHTTSASSSSSSSSSSVASPKRTPPHISASPKPSTSLYSSVSISDTLDADETHLDHHEETNDTSSSSNTTSVPAAGLVILDPREPNADELTITLMRLGGSGLGNIQLNVHLDSTLGSMLSRVYPKELASGHRVRIMFMGRMASENLTFRGMGVESGHILHVLIGAPPSEATAADAGNASSLIDPSLQQQQPQEPPLYHFADADGNGYPGNMQAFTEQQAVLMRQAQMSTQSQRHGVEGGLADFMVGVVLGFLLGVISLIWLLRPTVSRKQRLGILIGIALNFIIGLRNQVQEAEQKAANDAIDRPSIPEPIPIEPISNIR